MNIVEINSSLCGSIGSIIKCISKAAKEKGHNVYIACPSSRTNYRYIDDYNVIFIGSRFTRNVHRIISRFLPLAGKLSFFATLIFLKRLSSLKIDIIHLHNLHEPFLNYNLFFNYIKKRHIQVVWTLHDCWSFTGRCPHFQITKCNKWKSGCNKCPYLLCNYPKSYFDYSKSMWLYKKRCFTSLDDLTIVTPSNWLKNIVKESFFNKYTIKVINNGIDLELFNERPVKSKLVFSKYNIVLGVSQSWNYSKGLDIFLELSNNLPSNYRIVLVGQIDSQDNDLSNIFHINRTENIDELIDYYNAAGVFLNPTREDTFPTVNIESLACGTPVLAFNGSGSAEIIDDNSGLVISGYDIQEIKHAIIDICSRKVIDRKACRKRAECFNKNEKCLEYLLLFESILQN